jgi:hypothetical protein
MALSCTLHGIVGIQNATPCAPLDKKRFWKMDCFVPLLLDTDDSSSDLPASVFTFGGRTAPPEDGVYFINARLITSGGGDNTTIELENKAEMESSGIFYICKDGAISNIASPPVRAL